MLGFVGAVETDAIPALRMYAIELPVSTLAEDVAALSAFAQVVQIEADRTRAAESIPSDPRYDDQWSLPIIGWDQAFGTVSPSGSAKVAILDTGVDASHPDLDDKIAAARPSRRAPRTIDPNGHGTAMAGIVAAETDNGTGIAGVGYAGVRVMPVTVLGADGTGQDSDIIEGVVWAADHGADVILMAFSNPGYSASLQAAVDYAWSHGVVLVAATGNDGSSPPTFPAGDRGVVGVSSTNATDNLGSSSNSARTPSSAAPGVGILTTSAGGGSPRSPARPQRRRGGRGRGAAARERWVRCRTASSSVGSARTADAAGTAAETGNGRLNLARALVRHLDRRRQARRRAGRWAVRWAVCGGSAQSPEGYDRGPVAKSGTSRKLGDVPGRCQRDRQRNRSHRDSEHHGHRIGRVRLPQFDLPHVLGGGTSTVQLTVTPGTAALASSLVTVQGVEGTTTKDDTATLVVASNPVPTLSSLSPNTKAYGDPAFTMTLTGTNFVAGSIVRVNGANRSTTYVSSTQVQA